MTSKRMTSERFARQEREQAALRGKSETLASTATTGQNAQR